MSRIQRTESVGDSLCPVCHEQSEIFAFGPCDHAICYRCSTRMRVLCNQMYCPICRGDLPQVVFLTKKMKYDDVNRRSCIPNRKFKILLEDESVEEAYEALLEHRCRVCDKGPLFDTFPQLQAHMRRTHTLFSCDLCLNHLKIFSFERKFYNRKDLAVHRRAGDADNTSYRGHPLCRFCDERYFDNDELLRHLRKDHFYCHFCDATNSNEYYSDYKALKDHFRTTHFLCEEGACASSQVRFTHAFGSEIDLKAHTASEHLGNKSKAQVKELRTLDISFQFAPRRRGRDAAGISAEDYEDLNYGRGRGRHRNREEPRGQARNVPESQSSRQECSNGASATVPALDDFPTLGGKTPRPVSAPAPKESASSEEDFPKLLGKKKSSDNEDFPSLSGKKGPAHVAPVTSATVARSALTKSHQAHVPTMIAQKQATVFSSSSGTTDAVRPKASDAPPLVSGPPPTYPAQQNTWAAPRLTSGEDFPTLGGEKKKKSAVDGPNFVSLGVWSRKNKEDSSNGRSSGAPIPGGKQSASVTKPTSLASLGKALCDDCEFPSLGGARPSQSANWVEKKVNQPVASIKNSKVGTSSNKNKDLSSWSPPDAYVVLNGKKDERTEETHLKKKKKKQKEEKKKDKVVESGAASEQILSKEHIVLPIAPQKHIAAAVQESKHENGTGSLMESPDKLECEGPAGSDSSQVRNTIDDDEWQTVTNSRRFGEEDFPALTSDKAASAVPCKPQTSQGVSSVKLVVNSREEKENKKQQQKGLNVKSFREEDFPVLQSVQKTAPPPGFQKQAKVGVPPGLGKPLSQTQTRTPPGLSSPSATGSDNIGSIPMSVKLNMHTYVPPLDSGDRNRDLVNKVRKFLILIDDGFDQFRKLSGEFRSSQMSAGEYYRKCKVLFGEGKFADVLPELVALLPDILKQHELAQAHQQESGSATTSLALDSCPTCHQLLKSGEPEWSSHLTAHASLASGVGVVRGQAPFPKELPVTGITT